MPFINCASFPLQFNESNSLIYPSSLPLYPTSPFLFGLSAGRLRQIATLLYKLCLKLTPRWEKKRQRLFDHEQRKEEVNPAPMRRESILVHAPPEGSEGFHRNLSYLDHQDRNQQTTLKTLSKCKDPPRHTKP